MSTAITTAGETLIAQKHAAGEVLNIDTIILANIPGLDLAQPVDREQGKPAAENIVHEYVIPEDFKGFVNPNQVVYSLLLGSEIGNFQFNWLGLYSSTENVLVAVTELPAQDKWQTDTTTNKLGNVLTRNFLLQFSGAQEITNITVEARTWQVDFTARLRGIDERERQSNRDIYGRSCFFNDGFLVVNDAENHVLKAGVGYVEGIRCVLAEDTPLAASVLPKNVFLDVSLQQQGSNVVPVIEPIITLDTTDFEDANLVKHYLIKVAEIDAVGVVTDVRRTEAVTTDLVEYLKKKATDHAQDKNDPHETMEKVDALKSAAIDSESIEQLAVSAAVNAVRELLVQHKNATGDVHSLLPTGGTIGDCIKLDESGLVWGDIGLSEDDFPEWFSSDSGWKVIPSKVFPNGILLQWGVVPARVTLDSNENKTITFPIPFPNGCLLPPLLQIIGGSTSAGANENLTLISFNSSSAAVMYDRFYSAATLYKGTSGHFFVIGY